MPAVISLTRGVCCECCCSLLRDPNQLYQVVSSLVAAVGGVVPVTVKMRSGFEDTSLYENNLLAVQVIVMLSAHSSQGHVQLQGDTEGPEQPSWMSSTCLCLEAVLLCTTPNSCNMTHVIFTGKVTALYHVNTTTSLLCVPAGSWCCFCHHPSTHQAAVLQWQS